MNQLIKNLFLSFVAIGISLASTPNKAYLNPKLPIDKRVELLLKEMTLAEKVNQLSSGFLKQDVDDTGKTVYNKLTRENFLKGIGALQYINSPRNAADDAKTINEAQRFVIENSRLGIPMLVQGEALHGIVAYGATSFPQAIALAGTWDTDLIQKIFTQTALEARSRGTNFVFSPVLDIARDPRWGRMEETYGEDVFLVSQMGLACVTGLQGGKFEVDKSHVIASPKHFAGYGQCEGGRNFAPENITERVFLEEILAPFRTAIQKGHILGIMPSHSELDGVPAHGSNYLLTKILRQELEFKGVVASDYYDVERLNILHHVAKDNSDAALLALKSGVNFDLPISACYQTLVESLPINPNYLTYLNERVREILRVKFLLGLFENPYVDETLTTEIISNPKNKELAFTAGSKAITLLRNEKQILPLDKSKLKKIALIGPNADNVILGGYSPRKYKAVSIQDGLEKYLSGSGIEVIYAEGCAITKQKSASQFEIGNLNSGKIETIPYEQEIGKINNAVNIAKQADVAVVCVGDNYFTTREAIYSNGNLGDRANLDLVGNQNELVKAIVETGTPVIVVLMHGRSLTVNYIAEKANAVLDAWYLGEETGNVITKTLFGEINPGGKLPVTIPRSSAHLPMYYSQRASGTLKSYLFEDSTPLYPFGFGLSYTTFSISNCTLNKSIIKKGESCIVKAKLTNTGNKIGDEVVQVYVKDVVASVTRPVMQLKGFKRVTVDVGKAQEVEIELPAESFEMIGLDYKRITESGEFKILIGNSSVKENLTELTLMIE
ncbi:MAG: glycoside hydrolase family 3 N-terminal domain-containing protein [Bacteroidales bacterium]|nr:glycoside hydrolase family 3 N-terminal domain-containing protein [Bacteroidales bacterium]